MITFPILNKAHTEFCNGSKVPNRLFVSLDNYIELISLLEQQLSLQAKSDHFRNTKIIVKHDLADDILLFVGDADECCGVYSITDNAKYGLVRQSIPMHSWM